MYQCGISPLATSFIPQELFSKSFHIKPAISQTYQVALKKKKKSQMQKLTLVQKELDL